MNLKLLFDDKKNGKASMTVMYKKRECYIDHFEMSISLVSFTFPLCFYSRESKLCEIIIKALWTKAIDELKVRGEMVERIENRHHSINQAHEIIEKKIKVCIP